jgi:hypothetical protein
LRRLAETAGVRIARPHPHMLRHTFVTTCWMPGWTCGTSRSPHATPTHAPPCVTTGPGRPLDRHPNYILAAYMASGT